MADKNLNSNYFPADLIRSWDDGDGVNYAVAFARITGWLLHVDWVRRSDSETDENNMRSIRVYVGDNGDNIYDALGKMGLTRFATHMIKPLMKKRHNVEGGLYTVYYTEERLFELPLRVKPDPVRIEAAMEKMKSSKAFFGRMPIRKPLGVPAKLAADFTFGHCAPFALALQELTGLQPTAMIATKFKLLYGYSKTGYVHSFIPHPDGKGEDVWGIQAVEEIANRFGVIEYNLSIREHTNAVNNLKNNSPIQFDKAYQLAKELLQKYRV